MKDKIIQINNAIEAKRSQLKNDVETKFKTININNNKENQQTTIVPHKSKTPPISYILYGVAGLSALSLSFTGTVFAAASAFCGYKLSQNKKTSSQTPSSTNIDVSSAKTYTSTKILEIVKSITNDWDNYMEARQKDVQNFITISPMPDSEKDTLMSKVFVYEIIDIKISELSNALNSASRIEELQSIISNFQNRLLLAIDKACNQQIERYKSIS
ncbi:MAG: hypothetical protein Q4C30_07045 [Bacteroidia bacterium]|nr:hypothetical protein [Bacteroidia bacterium]